MGSKFDNLEKKMKEDRRQHRHKMRDVGKPKIPMDQPVAVRHPDVKHLPVEKELPEKTDQSDISRWCKK